VGSEVVGIAGCDITRRKDLEAVPRKYIVLPAERQRNRRLLTLASSATSSVVALRPRAPPNRTYKLLLVAKSC
jgi:hypothetical protein